MRKQWKALTIELNDHTVITADVAMKPKWWGLAITGFVVYSFESENKYARDGWFRRERLCDDDPAETLENWESLESLVGEEYYDQIREAWEEEEKFQWSHRD